MPAPPDRPKRRWQGCQATLVEAHVPRSRAQQALTADHRAHAAAEQLSR